MTQGVKKEKLIVFMIGRKKSNRLANSQTLFVRKYEGMQIGAMRTALAGAEMSRHHARRTTAWRVGPEPAVQVG